MFTFIIGGGVKMNYYYTIKADIHASTQNKKYQDLSKLVMHVNEDLDIRYPKDDTLIKLMIRSGDELFGIYKDSKLFLEVYQRLIAEAKTYKIPLYIGLGYGLIENVTRDEHLVNGPSIWQATKALESIGKGIGKYDEKLGSNIQVKVLFTDIEESNKVYQTLIYLFSEKILKRTKEQSIAVKLMKKYPNKSYSELYDLIDPKNISYQDDAENKRIKFTKYLQRAEYHLVNDMVHVIAYNLERLVKL